MVQDMEKKTGQWRSPSPLDEGMTQAAQRYGQGSMNHSTLAHAIGTADETAVIDLWLVHYREISDPALLDSLRQLLSAEDRQRGARFLHAEDRHRFLLTRSLVRTTLSRYAAVAPQDWIFTANEHGRPAIANTHPQVASLCFNLSHTRGLIVLGVCRGRELGVDVENMRERTPSPGIAERFFAPQEIAALANLPEAQRHERFFAYWTLKESYIKARGRGMSIPLDRFSFTFPQQDAIHLHIDADQEDRAARWHFWQFRHGDAYLLSVCTERRDTTLPSLRFHRTVPTVYVEECSLAPCAMTRVT